ncbi:MAG: thymidine phosphorylase [Gemmobacter sp.]|uniref:thymidine phosphorylase n=1 Tax=Gemmobacter sp. TaxID=1898957 RepID=UPI003918E31A
MSDARRIIATVRDGGSPSVADLQWFAQGLATGGVTDAQAGAFAMAVLLKGLGEPGRVALTRAMRDTGRVLTWRMDAPVVDKHSTGGVGDSISLLLAPALAECGVYVPMVSGRGLGHTGGTLDKLEAIPGYTVDQSETDFRRIVAEVGCAIVAATGEIAPADRRLYAIRDVTATVESIDLITASILSKKLSAGLEALVLDVKVGSGAFLPSADQAQALARALVDTAIGAGCRTSALITDMDQPLACNAGNAVEVAEVMGALTCDPVNQRLWDLTEALGGELLALCGAAPDAATGGQRIISAIRSGRAAERLARMVAAQGGPADFLERWRDHLPAAPVVRDVPALGQGIVARIDTRAVGEAVVHLGGGRLRNGDAIDPRVGFSELKGIGMNVGPGDPLAVVHAATEAAAERAIAAVQAAYVLGDGADAPDLVQGRVA